MGYRLSQKLQLLPIIPALTFMPTIVLAQAVDSIDEIIVTARRTEESIQSVPVSITALDSKILRENTISTPEDIQLSTPGVYLSGGSGRQNTLYTIRGQSKALTGTSSPGVVTYFAEVPDPQWANYLPQFDMSSIQVLKGPQGTLFGRNTTGGAILFTPNSPVHQLEGFVSTRFGNEGKQQFSGVLNVPILQDKLAMRLAADFDERDGYTKNFGVGGDLDAVDTEVYRASILFEPTDYIRNLTIYDHIKSDNDGAGLVPTQIITDQPSLLTTFGLLDSVIESYEEIRSKGGYPFVANAAFAQHEVVERKSIINRTEISVTDNFNVINIFGYRDASLAYSVNAAPFPLLTSDGSGFYPAGVDVYYIPSDLNQNLEQYSNELQFNGSSFDDKLDWLLGFFWLKNQPTGPQGNTVSFAGIVGAPVSPPAYSFVNEKSKSVFTHFTYDLSSMIDGLDVEIGLRYNEDEISSCIGVGTNTEAGQVYAPSDLVDESDCVSGDSDKITSTSFQGSTSYALTWSMGLNWQVSEDLFAYIVKRRGYRAGAINSPTLAGRMAQFQSLDPEYVDDYEVGIRADWNFNRSVLRTNVSIYTGEYDDVQTAVSGLNTSGACDPTRTDNPPGISADGDCDRSNDVTGGTVLANLGKSRVSGADIEAIYSLDIADAHNVTINFGASFMDTKTKELSAPPELAFYLTAKEIPFNYTPDQTFVGGLRYAFTPESDILQEFIFNYDYYWSDELNKGESMLDSYDVSNMRLDFNGLFIPNLDIGMFVRNVFDQEYTATASAAGNRIGFFSSLFGPPRMYGAEIRYSF